MTVVPLTSWDGQYRHGTRFSVQFELSQKDVDAFVMMSGDKNPIHFDDDEAASCPTANVHAGLVAQRVFSCLVAVSGLGPSIARSRCAFGDQCN